MLLVVGLNHRSASLADRERLSADADLLAARARAFGALAGAEELVLLSTCHRVELYAASSCPAAAALALRQALAERAGPGVPLFELRGDAALRHLASVAASLDSAVLGEPQILGQVKEAHQRAQRAGYSGRELDGAFERVYRAAKRVRTETELGRAGVSWGSATSGFAEKVLGSLLGRRVVVLGAGEMARAAGRHLREQGASITVLNRTAARAEALAAELGGAAGPLSELAAALPEADVVVAAAPVAVPALEPAALEPLMRARCRRTLVLVDLAVPRAIPAQSGALDAVYLADVDDLARATERGLAERAFAVAHARRIIDEELARAGQERAERRAAPLITALRRQAAAIAQDEVCKTARRLGADAELTARLDALAGAVVSKLLHAPSTRLRAAAAAGPGGDRLVAAAAAIFGLEAGEDAPAPPATQPLRGTGGLGQ